jgi:hypothetical protein
VPLVVSEPLQPPEAIQLVAFVETHVTVALPPDCTFAGVTVNVTVGAGVVTVGAGVVAVGATEPPPHAASNEAEPRMARRTLDTAIHGGREDLLVSALAVS